MGTNFYLFSPSCPKCGHAAAPLHIGKSSAGWCFTLHVDKDLGINSLADWEKRWAPMDVWIEDEYGVKMTPGEMLGVITEREWDEPWSRVRKPPGSGYRYATWAKFHEANSSEEGPKGLLRHRVGVGGCVGHGEGTWDLIEGEFS